MKLIRIGNSQSCDLKLDSDYVSALHAEMTILDDGKIILEDKNSTNGTTVGNKRIDPGKEIEVQRGDLITFADVQLVWARIPSPERLTNYKAVYNIGSNYRNDIILNSQTVSRYHASLRIGKDGKAYIRDNGSRNGTLVNGIKVSPNTDVRIKKGDNVVCGADDVTDQIANLIPPSGIGKIIAIAGGAIAAAAIIIAAIFLLPKLFGPKEPTFDPKNYRPAVVYVRTIFHPIVTFEDNPMQGAWDGVVAFNDMQLGSQATAFFLDSLGRMGTNRHVAMPWTEMSEDDKETIRNYIEDNLPRGNSIEAVNEFLQNSILANAVLNYAMAKSGNSQERFVNNVLNITSRLGKSPIKISGVIDHITVGYPGNFYTHADEFQRCNVLKVSDDENIDLAILQLNNKTTPKDIQYVFDPASFFEERLEPLKDQLVTIGYPAGIAWAQDENTKSLEPNIRETKCSKEPGKYDFEFQANSVGGSSGSPVFNDKGQLVGVLYGGYSIAGGSTKAVHAKFLKKMYDEEVNL